ncbi:MAG: NUDIX domain-containing protein [Anaerolineales bacterium]
MEPLKIIYRNQGVNINGKTISREAVRAVVFRENRLLLVYSTVEGDYKFPGGGVNKEEAHFQALIREVSEECGMKVSAVGPMIGSTVEYATPKEKGFSAFKMTSYYYYCQVEDEVGPQSLENYEMELGFTPVWISLEEAIHHNQKIYQSHPKRRAEWLVRELFMLEYIQQHQ